MADLSTLRIAVTKPKGKPAAMLAETGMTVIAVERDEGNVDRYILSKRLAIERRTGSSFLRGIMEKTLFTSSIYLREHFELPVLIIEGKVNYEYTGFDPQAVRGALSSMVLLYGLSVLATADLEETVQLITMMARQEQIGIPEISLIPKRKATDLPDMQRRLVEMLPGSGMVMAKQLLQRFGSVKRIVNASQAELLSQRGLGSKKVKQIHQVLDAEYEAVDTEKDLENAIEADPRLVLKRPVVLVGRQHYIYTEAGERRFVDLVFHDKKANDLILVELKHGRLAREHVRQLRGYLDHARQSEVLRCLLEQGASLRGVLATVEDCALDPKDPDVSVCIVDRKKAIKVLKRLRHEAQQASAK